MPDTRPHLTAFFALLALSGCAQSGTFPSLAPRPQEKALADTEEEAPPPVLADDAQLPARLDAFVAEGRRGTAAFEAALPAARAAVARAGAPGSDSWIEAQKYLSRLEAARSTTAHALSELDAFAVEQAKARPLSPGDSERIRRATETLQQGADAQQRESAALQARLGG
jgi:hypothetical protein